MKLADFNDVFCEPLESEFQPLLHFETEVLREAPHNDIVLLTQRIRRSFLDYVRQGVMLRTVRRYRLYQHQFKDFASYCRLALGRSHFYCMKIIEAAEVCLQLIKSKFRVLPTSVAQALPLVKFAKVDEYGDSQLCDKWQSVLDGFPPETITAAKIQEAVDDNPEDRAKQVKIGGKAYQLLQQKAAEAGLSISKYLEFLISGDDDTKPLSSDSDVDSNETELTPEKAEICDWVEAFVKLKTQFKRGFAKTKHNDKKFDCSAAYSDTSSDYSDTSSDSS